MSDQSSLCAVTGCGRPRKKREWCGMHYLRWYKHGDPAIALQNRHFPATCIVPGCAKAKHCRGLCHMHYQRWKKFGDVAIVHEKKTRPDYCIVAGCTSPSATGRRGMCAVHYQRWHTHGDPTVVHSTARPTDEAYVAKRFWPRVNKNGPIPSRCPELGPCHLWTGTCDRDGYGQFMRGRKRTRAHRFAWELAHGPVPLGKLVCHHCDNPPCVNEVHLFLGTHKDNGRDRGTKGRTKGLWWQEAGRSNPHVAR